MAASIQRTALTLSRALLRTAARRARAPLQHKHSLAALQGPRIATLALSRPIGPAAWRWGPAQHRARRAPLTRTFASDSAIDHMAMVSDENRDEAEAGWNEYIEARRARDFAQTSSMLNELRELGMDVVAAHTTLTGRDAPSGGRRRIYPERLAELRDWWAAASEEQRQQVYTMVKERREKNYDVSDAIREELCSQGLPRNAFFHSFIVIQDLPLDIEDLVHLIVVGS